jgi:hypothetical protein
VRLVEAALRRLRRAALVKCVYGGALVSCALLAIGLQWHAADAVHVAAPEWPSQWDGRELRPMALSEVEQRFAARFPGAIARMTDGRQQLVLRQVDQPTRMLHPAVDCYRGLGYRIAAVHLETDAQQRRWRCFEAERAGTRLRVCERIVDASGEAYTDTSHWYWSALLGRSAGPWQAVTTAQVL